ncbi:MAG: helix-turn-helix transcriptional regulator [Bacteroidota bacterium]|nr:helix-turn-helix transcriptional regulator [Bacteroidota bacterium]
MQASLSPREIEILRLIIENEYSSSQIAKTLDITVGTVDTHRKNIHKKTATKNAVGLVKYALKEKLIIV